MTKKPTSDLSAPPELIEHSRQRSSAVVASIRKAMTTIEGEIEQNDGLYPYNKGRVTQAEVCRRAGIRKTTLQGPSHKESTRVELDRWLKRLEAAVVKGRKSIRRTVTERADQWKEELERIANEYHKTELVLVDVRLRVRELEEENAALRAQLALGIARKITALPPKGK